MFLGIPVQADGTKFSFVLFFFQKRTDINQTESEWRRSLLCSEQVDESGKASCGLGSTARQGGGQAEALTAQGLSPHPGHNPSASVGPPHGNSYLPESIFFSVFYLLTEENTSRQSHRQGHGRNRLPAEQGARDHDLSPL